MKFSTLIEKLIPTGAGDWKTRTVSSMIFIQSAWLSTYPFRLNNVGDRDTDKKITKYPRHFS